jgi:hypothetical protein
MSTGFRFVKMVGAFALGIAVLCVGSDTPVKASSAQTHRKAKPKKPPLPPLPSGPTGPVQQIPLDSIAAVPPQVSYQDKQLTIVAPNSTLADILRAVRKQTGAEIEIPAAPERVVTRLGPGPARDVLADLLNGSRFNYVLLGSPGNEAVLTRVVLVPKTGGQEVAPAPTGPEPQPGIAQANNGQPADQEATGEANDAEADDSGNADDNADQAAEADQQQQPAQPEQPGVKTPQQMLQEMQQRQLQMQQQSGQPPVPGSGMPPHPPQEQ